jgi:alpha-beta hydrolase superfamily lysophospholipase
MPALSSPDARQCPFTFDGETLAIYDWPLPINRHLRAVVLMVHGLGEHAWRYDRLARELIEMGYLVRAYDQRGHGESVGTRGCLPSNNALLKDLTEVIDDTRTGLCKQHRLPLVLIGHGLGGLVATLWVARYTRKHRDTPSPVDALVLSSPALALRLNGWQRLLLATLPRWWPNLTVSHRLKPAWLSHDPQVAASYLTDPLVHDRLSPRLARFVAEGGPRALGYAGQWTVPTLLLYAGDDRWVDPTGSRRFAQSAPKSMLQSHEYPTFFHEVFNELHRQEVVEVLLRWLERRY